MITPKESGDVSAESEKSTSAKMPLAWTLQIADIPDKGTSGVFTANAQECADIADALDVVAVDSLICTYEIRPRARGKYHLSAEVETRLRQICVVTLGVVETQLHEPIDIEFWPAHMIPNGDDDTAKSLHHLDLGLEELPEAIERGALPVGRLVFEYLAVGLDPYPRAKDADFATSEDHADGTEGGENSPFAKLATLRKGSE